MTASIINHDLTAADAKAMQQMRTVFEGQPKMALTPETRPVFDGIMSQAPQPDGVAFEQGEVGGVPGWWATPENPVPGSAILYLHGGGYVLGSAAAYRNFVGHLAKRAGAAAFIPDYALAPERPFPAAPDDVRAALDGLIALDVTRIAVAGDSAGGGLALSAVQNTAPAAGRIVGVVALSPWIDMTLSGETMTTRAEADPLLSRESLEGAAVAYLGQTSRAYARLPGLGADLSTMPPVRIHTGDAEVLLSDSLSFAARAGDAGVDHEVHVWDGMTHVFPSSFATLDAGAEALGHIGAFLADKLSPPAAGKRVLVLGATGGTGKAIVRRLSELGHQPVAMVRSPEKARDLEAVTVEGDARDPAALDRAMAGVDAVVSSIGTPASPIREVTVLSTATKALVDAMKRQGVRRLVAITGMGAGNSRGHGGSVFDRIIMPLMLRKVYADKDRQEAVIRDSGLDWVIVRPSVLNDKPGHGAARALLDLSKFHGGTIARSDVADFVVDQIDSDTFLGQAPLLTW
ncbi:NAD-dependent epimerase/dehydratase family protein [Mesobaculum littorinae]|uniref:NAD-dependent epimerase/dehydratase family protein n=1 Tax=Mesobaculum littorinae TaxID=2486419 RepID=A0A438AES3_9RHOB|nr:NAD(P)H-binding protein [Mesobaculum littorinae]RVV97167.1 NAD-dependent epimerase/dehydratase family protein [Mesobaculum littorinae]